MEKAYLVLENGQVFKGRRFGAPLETEGELVFTTGMTGYLETLTDPSYHGQLVVQTFPLIGNYGLISADFESEKAHLSAYIVREWCREPSNFRSEGTLDTFLKSQGIPGLEGVDTRELTAIIREKGVMNARLCHSPEGTNFGRLCALRVSGAVAAVGCQKAYTVKAPNERFRVALWDFGAKKNIERELLRRGCSVSHIPPAYTAARILQLRPDGVLLSNGPGDPAENTGVIRELQALCRSGVPVFGICLGHQLLALAHGGETEKLKYGHRGTNQPVKSLLDGRVYITSQNHGYAVRRLPQGAETLFKNVNDATNEGIIYRNIPAFSVQFHPEAAAGPLDTGFLFDQFVKNMEVLRSCR
ncbi:MAG: carbamoyl phosphate synthase small subunit [Provencibacterium sp.]|jgi:carbamoyl-phosphate synthase small subunit|nr:carbamoyl phosphate synthase small subunit [Provencibacterium sp.]